MKRKIPEREHFKLVDVGERKRWRPRPSKSFMVIYYGHEAECSVLVFL